MPPKPTRSVRHSNPLIERWENAERVLDSMPQHERRNHFDMGSWGYKNDCGTIACAAGQCGLDQWFRRRGFKLVFPKDSTRGNISDVPAFFGLEGSQRIFFNSRVRPVETVLGEVREYIGELRRIDEITAGLKLPKIGSPWPEQGGHFAGVMLGKDGASDYLLVVGPEYDGEGPWQRMNEWAGTLAVCKHSDFTLFSRREGAPLFDRVRPLFQRAWYWTHEQHAASSDDAWAQLFGNGYQGYLGKDGGCRARAVRRVPIQSFSNSVISGPAS